MFQKHKKEVLNFINLTFLNLFAMRKSILLFFLIFIAHKNFAQSQKTDSVKTKLIESIIIISTNNLANKEEKPLSTIDEYLQNSTKIEMIRRGGYAWEPLINNMPTERTLVTIDGMRVFGACTDKMDPITSYLEISNLSEAEVNSGQEGSCHGATIGGSIDLKRYKNSFGKEKLNFGVQSGYETVNAQKIFGTSANFKNQKFYIDTDFMFRNAENYKDGNGNEVFFSQFRKFNISGISGVKIAENELLEASLIYDKASDVGYPALPMDVSLAEAIITSLKLEILPKSEILKNWETKIYYNNITHRMDDTTRPSVPIHMDMPGFSKTFGYYSKLKIEKNKHQILLNLNGFYNNSRAEMTMYPNNPTENIMFMLTWPDVNTLFQGIYAEDKIKINENSSVKLLGSIGFHRNKIESEFGLNSLQIFYPEMKAQKNRLLKSLASNYQFSQKNWELGLGLAYGERAPSVSEGYGFYLFNSFERFDYVGNPNLENEKSLEVNAFVSYKNQNFSTKISSSYFHISNYIVGKKQTGLVPMTIGANGVKIYSGLDYATVFNIDFTTEVQMIENLKWKSQFGYNRGKDNDSQNLPFMSPFSFKTSLSWYKNKFSSEISMIGNLKHKDFAPIYGETKTPAYSILNLSFGYKFIFDHHKIFTKIGVENILDKFYTTFSDWNKIPRPGRNFFLNLNYSL